MPATTQLRFRNVSRFVKRRIVRSDLSAMADQTVSTAGNKLSGDDPQDASSLPRQRNQHDTPSLIVTTYSDTNYKAPSHYQIVTEPCNYWCLDPWQDDDGDAEQLDDDDSILEAA
jgi:hypothetical protein